MVEEVEHLQGKFWFAKQQLWIALRPSDLKSSTPAGAIQKSPGRIRPVCRELLDSVWGQTAAVFAECTPNETTEHSNK